LAEKFGLNENDPDIVCLFWGILDEYGVEGLAHVQFSNVPMRRNWSHNERTFQTLISTERFQELYRSCVLH
jgi:hypothetical protein